MRSSVAASLSPLDLDLRPDCPQSQRRQRTVGASCTLAKMRLSGIGLQLQLLRRAQIPQPHPHRLGKSACCTSLLRLWSVHRRRSTAAVSRQRTASRFIGPLHAVRVAAAAYAAKISRATPAASVGPFPFSRNTTSAISGFVRGRIAGKPAMPPRAFLHQRRARLARHFHRRVGLRQVSHSVGHRPLQPGKYRRQLRFVLLRKLCQILIPAQQFQRSHSQTPLPDRLQL